MFCPCVGLITKEEYLKEVDNAQLLLEGKSEELINDFYKEMDRCSSKKTMKEQLFIEIEYRP